AGVARETRAAAAGVLVVDRSADAKYSLVGPGAREWLEAAAPLSAPDGESSAALKALPGSEAQVEALVRLLAHEPDRCMLTASPDQETRLREWLRRSRIPSPIQTFDA